MIRLSALAVLGLFFTCGAAPAQTIIKISPDRSTVTATNDRGTATSTIVRDGQGGGTITTRYQPNNAYKPMGSGGSYQPMGSSKHTEHFPHVPSQTSSWPALSPPAGRNLWICRIS